MYAIPDSKFYLLELMLCRQEYAEHYLEFFFLIPREMQPYLCVLKGAQ
jgi:hypothetical protein